MTENTLSSTNQLPTAEVTPSSENLSKPSLRAMSLSDIPVLKPSTSSNQTKPDEKSFMAPLSFDDGKVEYEFTNLWEGCLYCVHLYDTNDVSACERVLNRPVKAEEVSYSDTGNGFIVDGEFKYTFQKSPFQRTFTNITVKEAPRSKADDVLSEL